MQTRKTNIPEDAWREFLATRATDARNRIIEANLAAAMSSARSYLARWSAPRLDKCETMSIAAEALMRCIEAYRPEKYKSFMYYVHLRMRGFVRKRLRELEPQAVGGLAISQLSMEPSPDGRAATDDDAHWLLSALDDPARTILWLRANGETLAEIGRAVRLSTVRVGQILKKYERG